MARADTSTTPIGYHDRYERDSGWKKVLFRPGYPVQASELNEIQSLLTNEAQQIGLALFREGAPISGLDIIVDYETNIATIASGQIYALGYVHDVESRTVQITGSGIEVIGVKISSIVVTESDDAALRDSDIGAEAYGYAGAHRLTYDYTYTVNDASAIKIATLKDGRIDQTYTQLRPALESTLTLLAERTFDESGSYVVDPFKISIRDPDIITACEDYYNYIRLRIQDGRAYVKGWRVKNDSLVLNIDRPLVTESRVDEPEIYNDGTLTYRVDNRPIRAVTNLTATFRSPSILMNRGWVGGGKDAIPEDYQPVREIFEIKDVLKNPYSSVADYVHNGNDVDWSPIGDEPPPGGSYELKVDYIKQLVLGTRILSSSSGEVANTAGTLFLGKTMVRKLYDLRSSTNIYVEGDNFDLDNVTGVITWCCSPPTAGTTLHVIFDYWETEIEGHYLARNSYRDAEGNILYDAWEDFDYTAILPSGNTFKVKEEITFETLLGPNPVDLTLVYYDYEYTLPRKDILAVDFRGWFEVVKGTPDLDPAYPSINQNQMGIFYLDLLPEAHADSIIAKPYNNQRMTMVELRQFLLEFRDYRQSQVLFKLYEEADAVPLPTEKRGIYVDDFESFDKFDFENLALSSSLDVLKGAVSLPQSDTEYELVDSSEDLTGNFYLLDFTEEVFITQPHSTTSMQLNPYDNTNLGPIVSITPGFTSLSSDNLVIKGSSTSYTLPKTALRNRVFLTLFDDTTSVDSWTTNNILNSLVVPYDWVSQIEDASSIKWDVLKSEIRQPATIVDIMSSVKIELKATATTNLITVTGKNFKANEDNIRLKYDMESVTLVPEAGYTAGTEEGTMSADANGEVSASFTIPTDADAGKSLLYITSDTSRSVYITYDSEAIATEIFRYPERSITLPQRMVYPVAQTFICDKPAFISSASIYFKAKPSTSVPIKCMILLTDNGIPTNTILGESELSSDDCSVSDDASLETRFTFDNPAFLVDGREYAIVIAADVTDFIIHTSKIGQLDADNEWASTNPQVKTLLTSANLATWTTEQYTNLKFVLYKAKFDSGNDYLKEITYDPIEIEDGISRFELDVGYSAVSTEAYVDWYYGVDGGTWKKFTPPVEVDLGRLIYKLWIRASIRGNEDLSGTVLDRPVLVTHKGSTSGTYLHKQFQLSQQDCRYLDVIFDIYQPATTTAVPQVQFESDGTWHDMVEHATIDLINGWKEVHYKYDTGSDVDLKRHIQTRLVMTSTNTYEAPLIRRYRVVASTI